MKKILVLVLLLHIIVFAGCTNVGQKEVLDDGNSESSGSEDIDTSEEMKRDTNNEDGEDAMTLSTSSINGLLLAGKNVKCTYEDLTASDGTKVDSTIYVSGDKYKSEYTQGEKTYYHVSDGTWLYSWESGSDEGTKFNIKEIEVPDPEKPDDKGIGMATEFEMKCYPWIVVGSTFNIPGDVEFTDMTEMINSAVAMADELEDMDAGDNGDMDKERMCAMCEMAPTEEEKEQCRESVGC